MKKSFINKHINIIIFLLPLVFAGCKMDNNSGTHSTASHETYAPDSGVLRLVKPVNREVLSVLPTFKVVKERRIFSAPVQGIVTYDTRNNSTISSRFAGRIEKLAIHYNFQSVRKGQLIMEIFSPELANAQKELIYLHTSGADQTLVEAAKEKLKLLGVASKDIEAAIKTGKPLYRIPVYSTRSGYLVESTAAASAGDPSVTISNAASGSDDGMGMGGGSAVSSGVNVQPVAMQQPTSVTLRPGQYISAGQTLFNLYDDQSVVAAFYFPPDLAAYAGQGKQVLFYPSGKPGETFMASIGLVQPVQQDGQNFTIARAYISSASLKTGTRLTGQIAITTQQRFWLPRQAILASGSQHIIFKKANGIFKPYFVTTGLRIGDFVEVKDEIGGWEIAANAYFLVDSESFIPAEKIAKINDYE
jgi:membrane fusion protein, copper/silver efflux system